VEGNGLVSCQICVPGDAIACLWHESASAPNSVLSFTEVLKFESLTDSKISEQVVALTTHGAVKTRPMKLTTVGTEWGLILSTRFVLT
jgi:hypothetical protein